MPRAIKGSRDEIVARAIELMQAWIGRDHRLYEIAGALEVSHGFLEGIFKARVGVDLTTYRTFIRLHYARQLLACTALPIVEVARLAGFRHQAYFAKVFRDDASMTPTEYRTLVALQSDRGVCPGRTARGCALTRLAPDARLGTRTGASRACPQPPGLAPAPLAAPAAAVAVGDAEPAMAWAPARVRASSGRR